MRAAVVVFPGSNCDRDLALAFERAGAKVQMVWHKDADLPEDIDIVGIPGGFSFGDYLRCGAIAANSPICKAVLRHAERGGYAIGICNGFQVLTETGLLPGALMRNSGLKFICKPVELTVENADSAFTRGYSAGEKVVFPVAHHDGNYQAAPDVLERLNGDNRVAFRYVDNPNGSVENIAGVLSANGRVLGLMPHPERVTEEALGGTDGSPMFASVVNLVEHA